LTPAWVGTALTFLTLPVYWLLVRHSQHLGLALASSCGIIAYTVVLFVLLMRRTANREASSLVVFFLKVSAASGLAALATFELVKWLGVHIGWQTTGKALLVLLIASAAGFLLTGILAKLLRVRELDTYLKKARL
jgi:peptidoglycan biosynthesis protein MviN/MurJ (putative lipid II flippase)